MNVILFTHGKNPKPPATAHRAQLWRCLLHGIRLVDPEIAADIERADPFRLVAWSSAFYRESRDIAADMPWIDRLLSTPPDGYEHRNERPLSYRFARAMYVLGDSVPWLIPLIPDERVKRSIQETETYFANRDNIACHVRQLQKIPLREAVERGDRVLLIGHSMGSIIAYDALWELDHLENIRECVDCFLTLGSPLGMNYVQRRLIGHAGQGVRQYPRNIRRWVNISARGDLVALDPGLANDFRAMVDNGCVESITDMRRTIHNHYSDDRGLNVHKSYGYLVNPNVARVIADWWRTA